MKRYRGALVVCMLLLGYASLYPFAAPRLPGEAAIAAFFQLRYVVGFDVGLNVLAYVPLGILGCMHFRHFPEGANPIVRAVILGTALSLALESGQLFIPSRVSSVYDVLANAAGTLMGALFFSAPVYEHVTRPLGEMRDQLFVAGGWGDAGLLLVGIWLLAQLNPALPFFGAGDIAENITGRGDAGVLEWVSVGLSICGFALFLSALVKGPMGSLRFTLVLLSVALWLKFVAGSFMLKPHFSAEWVSGGRVAGLVGGLLAFIPLRRLGRLGRIYLAIVLILAGALFAKIFGAYSALQELLQLFRWPHGQLASFTTLTRFLHESWPFAALAFLIGLFFRHRRDPVS